LTATPLIDAYGVGAIGLNGRIVDAQSRFNLANLSDAGRIDPIETSIFARLLTLLRIDPALANAAAESLAALQRTDTGDVDTIRMRLWQLDDLLTIPGYTPAIVAKLRELVVILPRATPVNLNTAPPEVFAALFPSMQLPMAISLVEQRRRTYYRDAADFAQRLSAYGLPVPSGSTAFASQFFLLRSQVSIQDAVLQRQSLIERANGQARVLWSREEEPSWQP
jgi:general secretion pathway protein K